MLVILAALGEGIEALDGILERLRLAAWFGQLLDRRGGKHGILVIIGERALGHGQIILRLIHDEVDDVRIVRVLPDAVLIEMAVTRDFRLVAEALAVGADDDRRAGVHRVMGQRHHLMRQTAALGRVAAAVRAEAALVHVHVPQISADLLAHLDAVTRVELAADDGVVLQAEVLLRHVVSHPKPPVATTTPPSARTLRVSPLRVTFTPTTMRLSGS